MRESAGKGQSGDGSGGPQRRTELGPGVVPVWANRIIVTLETCLTRAYCRLHYDRINCDCMQPVLRLSEVSDRFTYRLYIDH